MLTDHVVERTLSELDLARLNRHARDASVGGFDAELDAADVRSPRDMPADIVTMRSIVDCVDPLTGERLRVTLCYPGEADAAAGRVSVLSPMGAGLLGRRVGDRVRWRTPGGEQRACTILALVYQPEAAGDYGL
jgi:regulator of nucleoside diphosphate kinase